jgi:hypothetical protein
MTLYECDDIFLQEQGLQGERGRLACCFRRLAENRFLFWLLSGSETPCPFFPVAPICIPLRDFPCQFQNKANHFELFLHQML